MTLREFRRRKGLTLMEMAELLGVHFTTVQKWETGVRVPDAIAVAKLEVLSRGRIRAASFVRQQLPVVQRAVSCNRFAGPSKSTLLLTRSGRCSARVR